MNYEYKVVEDLGIVGSKKLRLVSWNGNAPKLDLRGWFTEKNGNENCGKGLTLSDDEGKALLELLQKYFAKK